MQLLMKVAAVVLVLSACGQPSTTPCALVAQKRRAIVDTYCGGKDETCWFCRCGNKGEEVKAAREGDTVVFSCVARNENSETCPNTIDARATQGTRMSASASVYT